jgi:uncharacterized surface protein with fasciclin (FAS1) repeats
MYVQGRRWIMKAFRIRPVAAAFAVIALAGSTVGGVAVAGDSAGSRGSGKNIVETAVAAGSFKTLVSLVGQAGLADTLATGGTFTVFAPTDAAFAKVPKKTLSALAANPEQLKSVLLYHVAKGELRAKKVVKRNSIKTLNGARVKVKVRRGSVKINNARILKANVDASNGVIHVINRVLIPPTGKDD